MLKWKGLFTDEHAQVAKAQNAYAARRAKAGKSGLEKSQAEINAERNVNELDTRLEELGRPVKGSAHSALLASRAGQGRQGAETGTNYLSGNRDSAFEGRQAARVLSGDTLGAQQAQVARLKAQGPQYKTPAGKDPLSPIEQAKAVAARARRQGGGYSSQPDVRYSPHDMGPLIKEQAAWESMVEAFWKLAPEHQSLLPSPGPAPIMEMAQLFAHYIRENADEPALKEARESTGMLSPAEVDEIMSSTDLDTEVMERILPLYKVALPQVSNKWLPIMVRADILNEFLKSYSD